MSKWWCANCWFAFLVFLWILRLEVFLFVFTTAAVPPFALQIKRSPPTIYAKPNPTKPNQTRPNPTPPKKTNKQTKKTIGSQIDNVPSWVRSRKLSSETSQSMHRPHGLWWVSLGFNVFDWGFYRVFTGFLLGFTRFYWVNLGFIGFYRVLLGFTGF